MTYKRQSVHTEVTKREPTKLYHMSGSGPDLPIQREETVYFRFVLR